MNKRPPAKKPQAKIQTVKKQIPIKKIAPDRIEELVKKHLGNIGEAENAFKSAAALLEKHKTKYRELEQYIENVSASDRSIQILEDINDPRRAHYIFKILLTGVESAYQVAHPGERIIPTWIGRPGFPLLKRLWQKPSFRSSFHAKPSRLLKGWAPQRNRIPTPDPSSLDRARSGFPSDQ